VELLEVAVLVGEFTSASSGMMVEFEKQAHLQKVVGAGQELVAVQWRIY
jgi:hypothetical protein